jgi:hypothetical protein
MSFDNMNDCQALLDNLGKLHTTEMGIERIKRNLGLAVDDVVEWRRKAIAQTDEITRSGKNYYATVQEAVITANANSYTIITAHSRHNA